MKAVLRRDLMESGVQVPTNSGGYVSGTKIWNAKFVGDEMFIHDGVQWVGVNSIDFDLMPDNHFPNGFTSWRETFFDVVTRITLIIDNELPSKIVHLIMEMEGRGGLYDLAESLTDEFEEIHRGRQWDGEYVETVEMFLDDRLA